MQFKKERDVLKLIAWWITNKLNFIFFSQDGSENVPVITHKIGQTQETLLEDVIKLIDENVFKSSPFPIILQLDNHCSYEV